MNISCKIGFSAHFNCLSQKNALRTVLKERMFTEKNEIFREIKDYKFSPILIMMKSLAGASSQNFEGDQ